MTRRENIIHERDGLMGGDVKMVRWTWEMMSKLLKLKEKTKKTHLLFIDMFTSQHPIQIVAQTLLACLY